MNLSHPIRITRDPRQQRGRLRGEARRRAGRCRRRPGIEGLEGRPLLAAKSLNVGIIGGPSIENGGTLPTTGTDVAGFSFTTVDPATFDATTLASYDTLVLNVTALPNQSLTALSAAQKADLVSFVGNGGKLIIYDSESPAQNYDWLPYTFSTNNPGAQGAQGTLSFSESNTLANDNSANPSFVDVNYLSNQTDAVGDANVFVSNDSHWCATLSALNTTGTYGATLAYATYSTSSTTQGMFIYNGLDEDYLGAESSADGLRKIWVNELNQGFNPVSTTDPPCAAPVTGIKLEPATATNQIGATHTVTATLQDLGGGPQVGVHVTFAITGANASAAQTISPAGGLSDANGVVTMTYTGTVIGTDTITASFANSNNQTIMSTPVTATWTAPNTTPPVSVDRTFYTHADTTLSVPINGVLANDTDPDPSHTPLLQAIQVSAPSHGTLTLESNGSFVYVPNPGFVGQDSFQYKAFDGQETGNTATVTLTVFQPLTIGMSQASDSGVSNTDQITNINTPVFQGKAEAGSVVQVFAQAMGQAPVMIGETPATAQGTWSITSSVLADGGYHVYALEQHPATPGRDAERTYLTNPVVIDTVGPRIDNVAFDQATGRWAVVVQDSLAGLNQATLADPSNYELIKLHTPFRYQLAVTGVSVSPAASPTAAQTVILQMANGRRLGPGYYMAAAKSGGIADIAGNALDGEFVGPLPSGDGHPGGNFLALLRSIHGRTTARPPDMFAIERASLHNPTFPLATTTMRATDPKVNSVRAARTAHPLRIAAAATHHRVDLRAQWLHRHA